MQMKQTPLLVMSIGFVLIAAVLPASAQPANFAVIADPHFYDAELGTACEAFQTYLTRDRKMLVESEAILKSTVK